MARAYGSTSTSTTTGPPVWASAALIPLSTSPGSSMRMPLAPMASATAAKLGLTKSVPYGTKPASCCSILTKSSALLFSTMCTTGVRRCTSVSRSPRASMVNPPSPHSAIVCRPGKATWAPNALGEALAIDAHENDPNSRRRGPYRMCRAAQMIAVPVSAKNKASSAAWSLSTDARYSGRMVLRCGPLSV